MTTNAAHTNPAPKPPQQPGIGVQVARTHSGACQHPVEETCANCRPWWGSAVSRNDL